MQCTHGRFVQLALVPATAALIYVASHNRFGATRKDPAMTTRNPFSRFGSALRTFGSAIAASSAVERGKAPADRDLIALGIDPKSFARIGGR